MTDFFDFHHHKKKDYGIYNLNLFENPPERFFSAGLHPKDLDDDLEEKQKWLYNMAENNLCVAIGECGLDALVTANAALQEKVFKEHIALANALQKPVIIHCVRRFPDLIKFKKQAKVPLIVHGFNKKKTIAEELLNQGFYFSFGYALLHHLSLQNVLKEMPLDKFFLETDDADFSLSCLYQKTAEIKGISLENLEQQIKRNLENIGINAR